MAHIYHVINKGPLAGYEIRIDIIECDYSPAEPSVGIFHPSIDFHPDGLKAVFEIGNREFEPHFFNDMDNARFLFDMIDMYQHEMEEAIAEDAANEEAAYWDAVATERKEKMREAKYYAG